MTRRSRRGAVHSIPACAYSRSWSSKLASPPAPKSDITSCSRADRARDAPSGPGSGSATQGGVGRSRSRVRKSVGGMIARAAAFAWMRSGWTHCSANARDAVRASRNLRERRRSQTATGLAANISPPSPVMTFVTPACVAASNEASGTGNSGSPAGVPNHSGRRRRTSSSTRCGTGAVTIWSPERPAISRASSSSAGWSDTAYDCVMHTGSSQAAQASPRQSRCPTPQTEASLLGPRRHEQQWPPSALHPTPQTPPPASGSAPGSSPAGTNGFASARSSGAARPNGRQVPCGCRGTLSDALAIGSAGNE